MSEQVRFLKMVRRFAANAVCAMRLRGGPSVFVLGVVLTMAARAEAQLPDAPSASVIAPLRRYSLSVSLDNKYSLTTSGFDLTPRMGMTVRLGERETLGCSFSHAMSLDKGHAQNSSVLIGLNFRMLSWGKIPIER